MRFFHRRSWLSTCSFPLLSGNIVQTEKKEDPECMRTCLSKSVYLVSSGTALHVQIQSSLQFYRYGFLPESPLKWQENQQSARLCVIWSRSPSAFLFLMSLWLLRPCHFATPRLVSFLCLLPTEHPPRPLREILFRCFPPTSIHICRGLQQRYPHFLHRVFFNSL